MLIALVVLAIPAVALGFGDSVCAPKPSSVTTQITEPLGGLFVEAFHDTERTERQGRPNAALYGSSSRKRQAASLARRLLGGDSKGRISTRKGWAAGPRDAQRDSQRKSSDQHGVIPIPRSRGDMCFSLRSASLGTETPTLLRVDFFCHIEPLIWTGPRQIGNWTEHWNPWALSRKPNCHPNRDLDRTTSNRELVITGSNRESEASTPAERSRFAADSTPV